MSESRLPGSKGDVAKKITVKLWGGGVFAKNEAIQGSANTQYFERKAGQLIYSKLDFLNQAFGIIPDDLDGYESTADLPCFDISADLNPAFILECVKRKNFYRKVGEAADGSRIAKRIHPETFLKSEIPLPSLPEQRKIADCLASADALIEAQARKVAALRAHKKGLVQQLFPQKGKSQPRLRFSEFAKAGEWDLVPLERFLKAPPGYGVSAAAVPYDPDLPKYLRITDISEDGRYLEDKKVSVDIMPTAENYLDNGDIAITRTGASVGKSYQYRREDGELVYAGFLIRLRPDQRKLATAYLAQYLVTPQYWEWIAVNSARSGQPGINSAELSSLPVPLPPLANSRLLREQQRIADCLSSLDDLIAAETRKFDTLKTHKKGLMQQLFPQVGEE